MSTVNYSSPNFGIPQVIPADMPPGLIPYLKPLYIAFQNTIQTLIRFTGIAPRNAADLLTSINDPTALLANNTHRFYTQATENIAFGALISLTASLGILAVRNANATDNTKPCDGFCNALAGLSAGQVGEIILTDGLIVSLSGLVPGTRYYLSTIGGTLTTSPPVAAGNLQQSVGIALTATDFRFILGQQIQH